MSILIDTSIWSLALRRHRRDLNPAERAVVLHCRELIIKGEANLIGAICQEALSGIPDKKVFEQVRQRLLLMDELPTTLDTHILAAEFYNVCRAHGTAGGPIDMTICAAAHLHNAPIFTTDPDFGFYARHLPITLHTI